MRWITQLSHRVSFFLSPLRRWFSKPYKARVVIGELPATLTKKTVYIVEEDGFQEQAAMICPCGCGSTLHMSLVTEERPCWHANVHTDGTITLHPSVWRKVGCGSHFWLRKGRLIWV